VLQNKISLDSLSFHTTLKIDNTPQGNLSLQNIFFGKKNMYKFYRILGNITHCKIYPENLGNIMADV
jgi:hypothetical protein